MTKIIIQTLLTIRGLPNETLSFKLICFTIDDVNVFHGAKIGVTLQIQMDYVLHMQGIHYMAHQTNLAMETFFMLNMVNRLENLLQTLYAYFSLSLIKHLELNKLVEIMGI